MAAVTVVVVVASGMNVYQSDTGERERADVTAALTRNLTYLTRRLFDVVMASFQREASIGTETAGRMEVGTEQRVSLSVHYRSA